MSNQVVMNEEFLNEVLIHLESINKSISSPYDRYIFWSALFSLVLTLAALIFTIAATRRQIKIQEDSLKKLSQQIDAQNKQTEQQYTLWKNESILKEKQSTLISFRKKYISFSTKLEELNAIIMPNMIAAKTQDVTSFDEIIRGPFTNLDDDSDVICMSYPNEFSESPNDLLKKYTESCIDLSDFIANNEIFINDDINLLRDISQLVRAYGLFLNNPRAKQEFANSFVHNDSTQLYNSIQNINLRYIFFMTTLRNLTITRTTNINGRTDTHISSIIHMLDEPVAKLKFTEEELIKAARNGKISNHICGAFSTWFNFWRASVNGLLSPYLKHV